MRTYHNAWIYIASVCVLYGNKEIAVNKNLLVVLRHQDLDVARNSDGRLRGGKASVATLRPTLFLGRPPDEGPKPSQTRIEAGTGFDSV